MKDLLFSPFKLGSIELKNRVVMAPMTRSRSTGNVPGSMVVDYYRQRSGAGLIVTEGTSPSPNGLGYARIPGLFNEDQMKGWQKVAAAVQGEGSRIFVQLMHTGRVSQPLNMPEGTRVLAPSAVKLEGKIWTDSDGEQEYAKPEEMTEDDIKSTIAEYARAAELAVQAGCDGIEVHAANGYLADQFLNTASNKRTDSWGGSIENRIRFALEVARAAAAAIGADRVGIRVSPYGVFNGMTPDPETEAVYEALAAELSALGLVYMHIVDHSSMGAPEVNPSVKQKIRAGFKGAIILSGGYDCARAEADLDAGKGDLVAFGRPFISNPDLVEKLKSATPLTPLEESTLYTPGEKGYTDY